MQDKRKATAGIPSWALESLYKARIGHLASSTTGGRPLVVPICFTFDGELIYSAIDEKPKKSSPLRLRRIANIAENPQVSFITDDYSEDWRKLRYVLVNGTAEILTEGKEFSGAISRLREKYRQYRTMKLELRPIIRITPLHIAAWAAAL